MSHSARFRKAFILDQLNVLLPRAQHDIQVLHRLDSRRGRSWRRSVGADFEASRGPINYEREEI